MRLAHLRVELERSIAEELLGVDDAAGLLFGRDEARCASDTSETTNARCAPNPSISRCLVDIGVVASHRCAGSAPGNNGRQRATRRSSPNSRARGWPERTSALLTLSVARPAFLLAVPAAESARRFLEPLVVCEAAHPLLAAALWPGLSWSRGVLLLRTVDRGSYARARSSL
jgi:hypothetical protein